MPSLLTGALSGLLAAVAFPPGDAGWVALICLIPLAALFRSASPKGVLYAAVGFGVVFFGALLSWIHLFGLGAYLALVLLETAIVAGSLWLAALARPSIPRWMTNLLFMVAMVFAEVLRGNFPLGGFTWGVLGYSQHNNLPMLRAAQYLGVAGVSAIVIAIDLLLTSAIFDGFERPRRALVGLTSAAAIAALPSVLPAPQPQGASAGLALIQGNAPENTLDPHYDDLIVMDNHIRLTRELTGHPDLVVWPESSLDLDPFVNEDFGRKLTDTVTATNAPFMVGATIDAPGRGTDRLKNTSLFFDPEGRLKDIYAKRHLVPFGERVPARKLLEPILSQLQRVPYDIIPGKDATVFSIPQGRFASVICFESTFPELVRSSVLNGARLLVVSTNNSSFARSAASSQHVAFSQVRAAENRMWVAHAALTGISALISPDGRVTHRTGLFEPATIQSSVRFATSTTFYARHGDLLGLSSAFLFGLFLMIAATRRLLRRPKTQRESGPVGSTLVVVPTYNEHLNIVDILTQLLAMNDAIHILVVDDASPDGTADLADAFVQKEARVHLLRREGKAGLGRAYVAGFRWGLERNFDSFVEIDADGSHDPQDLDALIAALHTADLVIGTRYMRGGGVQGWSRSRHLLSRSGNLFARLMLGLPLRDATSGFRCYRRHVLETVDLDGITSGGYTFQIEMAYRAWRSGSTIAEVPIIFKEREFGESKMSGSIVTEAIRWITWWGFRDLFRRRV